MAGQRRVFRSSFPVLWRWATIFCGILSLCLYVVALISGFRLPLGLTAAFALFLGVIFAAAVVCFPVFVSPEGVRCYNYFGFYKTVPWDAMTGFRRENIFGLRYLAVDSSSGWFAIYIPLYLSDMAGFAQAVREFGGEGHPLLKAVNSAPGKPGVAADQPPD
jgi:hypothetical protein